MIFASTDVQICDDLSPSSIPSGVVAEVVGWSPQCDVNAPYHLVKMSVIMPLYPECKKALFSPNMFFEIRQTCAIRINDFGYTIPAKIVQVIVY